MNRDYGTIECCDCGVTAGRTGSRQKRCTGCAREANRETARRYDATYREANREARREHSKAYHEANRDAECERNKVYREANREARREYSKAYCAASREAKREYDKAYREAMPKGDPTLSGQRWSPGENALVMDPTLSVVAVCELTGRSFRSVTHRRQRLRKKQALANA